jgi:FkbM family methyltransferase
MMNLVGLMKRLRPLIEKAGGRAPLCPWSSVLAPLDPRTLGAYPPPQKIEAFPAVGSQRLLRFNGLHDIWFPINTQVSAEMWSEYLAVFWNHPANAHRYVSHGTPIVAGDICLDCGACEGTFSLQALEAGAGKVVCLEPSTEMVDCVKKTLSRPIDEGRVVILNAAVGVVEGEAQFTFDAGSPFGGSIADTGEISQVKVQTITNICEELNLPRVDFVKMDIEGAEIQAIEGALPTLKRHHPKLAITTYHRAFDYAALRAILTDAGYRTIKAVGCTERGEGVFRPVMLHAHA